jgi:hypothetical protein
MIGLILKMSLALLGLMFFIFSDGLGRGLVELEGWGGLSSSFFSSWGREEAVGGMVSLVLCPMVMKRSLRALAMSVGSVYVLFSYMMVVEDVRCCDRDGMSYFRIFACCFGLFFVSCNCVSSCCCSLF